MSDSGHAVRLDLVDGAAHRGLVHGVNAGLRDPDRVELEAERVGLGAEQLFANAVHADPVVTFRQRGEKARDFVPLVLLQAVQGDSGVLAAGPGHDRPRRHAPLTISVSSRLPYSPHEAS